MKYIDQENIDLKGKKVLLRLDLNVPIVDGQVTDAYRIESAIDTVDFLRSKDAQTIIIAHCEGKESKTLLPMFDYLKGYFPIEFSETYFTPEANHKLLEMKDRDVLLFENLRINEGEKNPPAGGDDGFAKKLSQMADIYVNDAFSVSHRAHASIVGVPKFLPSYGGPLLRKEIENLSKAFNPERPFVFILGGAKFDTKLPIIKKYIQKADNIFVGGALANNFFRAMGVQTGTSLVAEGDFGEKEMLESKSLKNPVDVTVKGSGNDLHFKNLEEISKDDYIGDVGPKTIELLKEITKDAKTIVWNGPLGNFEAGFNDKTEQLAEIIAELSHSNGCTTIIGGGDTISSIQKLGILDKFSFVSTGGGAMLDFLVEETLVGIEALK